MTPVKFGISFTATFYNQGGALVLVYRDGSVQVSHGGTEMGQGLFTKIRQIAADGLGVSLDRVRMMPTRTDKVPNTSATAASAGTDLNGAAVADACAQIRSRLADVAGRSCGSKTEPSWRVRQDPPCVRQNRMARRDPSYSGSRRCARRRIGSGCRCSPRGSTARRRFTSIR
jgi:xanthine dehydrogenase molybdopterin-binding subunit B